MIINADVPTTAALIRRISTPGESRDMERLHKRLMQADGLFVKVRLLTRSTTALPELFRA